MAPICGHNMTYNPNGRPFKGCTCDWCEGVRAVRLAKRHARALNPQTGLFVSPELRAEARAAAAAGENAA